MGLSAGLGNIVAVRLDGSGYRELKVGDGLAAVALTGDLLFWMSVGGKGSCFYSNYMILKNLKGLKV